jgi:hypothetical protein
VCHVSLAEETDRLLAEIQSRQYVWDRAEREAAAMRTLAQAELCAWAREALLGAGARSLSVHAHEGSVSAPTAQPTPPGSTRVDEPVKWKAGLRVYRKADRPLPDVEPDKEPEASLA